MIMTVDRVLNDIWQVHERRPLSQRVLIYWAIITLGPIVIGASLTASSYLWSLSEDAIKQHPGLAAQPDRLRTGGRSAASRTPRSMCSCRIAPSAGATR